MRSVCPSKVVFVLISLFLLFFQQQLEAAIPVVLEKGTNSFTLGRYLEYLADPEGTLSIYDVDRKDAADKFLPHERDVINFGFTTVTYWVKFTLKNDNPDVTNWLLEIGYPHLDYVDFYFPDGHDGYNVKHMGDMLPFSERDINHRLFLIERHIDTGETLKVFMRISTQSSFQVPLTLWEPVSYSEKVYKEELGYGVYYGIMIVMVLYNLFLFFSMRDKATLYYVLYIGTFGFGIMSLNGVPTQFLWANHPLLANKILLVSLYLAMSMLCLFSRTYLNTGKNAPRLDKSIVFLMIFGMVGAALSLFIPYELGVKLVALFGVSCPIPTFIAGVVCLKKGIAAARFYLIAWIFLLVGILVLSLRNFGILPSVFITEYAVQIGSAMEVILLSLGLADRINIMKKERFVAQQQALSAQEEIVKQLQAMDKLKDGMNRSLEEKVTARTEELSRAMGKMARINHQLRKTSEALWGEMELAKRIQTILLPRKPDIPGYDIAAYMAPAEEVGGDYYDIINCRGKNWLVIGDVSGHGVPAGLIMMMVQTAIHVTVTQNPDLKPSQVLTIINQTITRNIQLMSDDKYMTLTVMAVHENGSFVYSGLHQDILIYRKEKGRVDVVETQGIWLGVSEDINGFLRDDGFKMAPGDLMLVFTDGITEAWDTRVDVEDRRPDTHMFGQDALLTMMADMGDNTADTLLQRVVEALSAYETGDDVTMVAVRRM